MVQQKIAVPLTSESLLLLLELLCCRFVDEGNEGLLAAPCFSALKSDPESESEPLSSE